MSTASQVKTRNLKELQECTAHSGWYCCASPLLQSRLQTDLLSEDVDAEKLRQVTFPLAYFNNNLNVKRTPLMRLFSHDSPLSLSLPPSFGARAREGHAARRLPAFQQPSIYPSPSLPPTHVFSSVTPGSWARVPGISLSPGAFHRVIPLPIAPLSSFFFSSLPDPPQVRTPCLAFCLFFFHFSLLFFFLCLVFACPPPSPIPSSSRVKWKFKHAEQTVWIRDQSRWRCGLVAWWLGGLVVWWLGNPNTYSHGLWVRFPVLASYFSLVKCRSASFRSKSVANYKGHLST